MAQDLNEILGIRIREARKRLGLTQEELAAKAGLPALQTVSQIEKGERDLKAWELARVAQVLLIDVSELLSPVGPAAPPPVLWREKPAASPAATEAAFLQRYQQYADLEILTDMVCRFEFPRCSFNARADFGETERLAGEISHRFDLGSRPGLPLAQMLEERFGVKIWYEDLGQDGSAACTVGPFGPAVLMNSAEAPWRRNFNFAHEVFHLLTWDAIPVSQLKDDPAVKGKVERLANAFASNLLLPSEELRCAFEARVKNDKIDYTDLIGIAREFEVSTEALLYRLSRLRYLSQKTVDSVLRDEGFRRLDRTTMPGSWWAPPPFPTRFVRLGFLAWKKGKLSRARLAEYLNIGLPDLSDLLCGYGLDDSADYEGEIPVT